MLPESRAPQVEHTRAPGLYSTTTTRTTPPQRTAGLCLSTGGHICRGGRIRTYDDACCGTKVEYPRSSTPPYSYGLDLHYSTTATRRGGVAPPPRARSDTGPRIRPCSPWSPLMICHIMRTHPNNPTASNQPVHGGGRVPQAEHTPKTRMSSTTRTRTPEHPDTNRDISAGMWDGSDSRWKAFL